MKPALLFCSLALGITAIFIPARAAALTASSVSDIPADTLVEHDFKQRVEIVANPLKMAAFTVPMTDDVRHCMMFLYAYMPLPDLTDYSGVFFRENVDYALKARHEMPWGEQVPLREFMHFVLPVRVNNENLDHSRRVFYDSLKTRVQDLTMQQAILEVNHWCHEKVTYQPSDARTSSPLATLRTAYGRCGEESTLLVAALRAVGIPARQVYTPRWAHTDDNHAWVEAWADGKWYFLGACEPEAVLNKAWFNASASRGMLMHTKVFGRYDGPEEVVDRNPCYTEINVTSHYAPTATLNVKVLTPDGLPAAGARVQFKVYNYAEFYTVATLKADAEGQARLSLGKGTILVWADKNGAYGWNCAQVGNDPEIQIRLTNDRHTESAYDVDWTPPRETPATTPVDPELEAANRLRLAQEDSIRRAYEATFPTPSERIAMAQDLELDTALTQRLILNSRGNYATIQRFLRQATERRTALALLQAISEKDLRDVQADVLFDHLNHTPRRPDNMPADIYTHYVLNPRVDNEWLTPYKSFFAHALNEELAATWRQHPDKLATWCRTQIATDSVWNPQALCMNPQSVWEMRQADAHSKQIFYVSVARSLGIAARIDPVTGQTQYWQEGSWHAVPLTTTPQAATQREVPLTLRYKATRQLENPKYYTHFTLSRIINGTPVLLNFPETATLQSVEADGLNLTPGQYLLTTGIRQANGNVACQLQFFTLPDNKKGKRIDLTLRHTDGRAEVIGSLNAESVYTECPSGKPATPLSVAGRGFYVLGLLDPNTEPTSHALRDLKKCSKELEAWGRKIILLFASPQHYEQSLNSDEFKNMPANVTFGIDTTGSIRAAIDHEMRTGGNLQMPAFVIADTFNRIVHFSQGYTIGLGDQLLKVIRQLE